MPKLRGRQNPAEPKPGSFMPDGSYFADGELTQRGAADRFVRAMVQSRLGPGFSPEVASRAVVLAKQERAFPNWRQWSGDWPQHLQGRDAPSWSAAWTSTPAEEAVKRCGRSTEGSHWCGELWVEGLARDCAQPGHRQEKDPERVSGLLQPLTEA